jgi:hypothetical protein
LTRYRSDWVISSGGLEVNAYDDTAAAYLPFSFSSKDQYFKSYNGSTYFQTGTSPVTRLMVADGLTQNFNPFQIRESNGTSPYLEWFQAGVKNWTMGIPASATSLQILEDGGDLRFIILAGGNIGLRVAVPTAKLHIAAGSATAGTAPLKFTSGTLLTTPEPGAIEYDGTHFYGTDSGGTRHQLD